MSRSVRTVLFHGQNVTAQYCQSCILIVCYILWYATFRMIVLPSFWSFHWRKKNFQKEIHNYHGLWNYFSRSTEHSRCQAWDSYCDRFQLPGRSFSIMPVNNYLSTPVTSAGCSQLRITRSFVWLRITSAPHAKCVDNLKKMYNFRTTTFLFFTIYSYLLIT